VKEGIVTVFCQGWTGTVTTIDFEPGVVQDLKRALDWIAPSDIPYWHDKAWQDGNGFSHVRASLVKPSLTIPVVQGTGCRRAHGSRSSLSTSITAPEAGRSWCGWSAWIDILAAVFIDSFSPVMPRDLSRASIPDIKMDSRLRGIDGLK
jgi:hypothetical protein